MNISKGLSYFNDDYKQNSMEMTGSRLSFNSIGQNMDLIEDPSSIIEEKKKRGRPSKAKTLSDGSMVITSDSENDLNMYQSNEPYDKSYNETNNMLKSVILQSDMMTGDLTNDISSLRSSRTIKNKYNYISLLSSTCSAFLGSKVTAIRELNKTITDCHNLEMKRVKEFKLTENVQDDDKRIMDMYNAFISTPVGGSNFIPSQQDLNFSNNFNNIPINNDIGGFDNYLNNITMEQNSMRYEGDSSVKVVVVYNQDTGARYFDVKNLITGESVPNASKPDSMFLENINIDIRNNIARDTNLDKVYPLIVTGKVMNEY